MNDADETGCEFEREACGHYVGECECDELGALVSLADLDAMLSAGLVALRGQTENGLVQSYGLTPAGRAFLQNALDSKKLLAS